MAAPFAALLAGPVIRLLVIVVAAAIIIFYADFGGLADTIIFEIEQLLQSLISPF